MSYYFLKVLTCEFDKAVEHVTLALRDAASGIITEIDVRETFKRKLDADFRNYRILGACEPTMAREGWRSRTRSARHTALQRRRSGHGLRRRWPPSATRSRAGDA